MKAQQKAEPLDFAAAMTKEQVQRGELRFNGSGDAAIARRATMYALSRSKRQLIEGFGESDESREGLITLLAMVQSHVDDLKASLSLAETAQARLFIAGDAICNGTLGLTTKKKPALRARAEI